LERFIATPCQAGEWLHQLRNVPRIGVPGIDGPGSDEPLVWYEGAGISDRRFPLADERGSIIAITNASGSVTNINAYDEYGIPASSNVGRFGYTGQTWLPEVGMNYYKARIYSPTLGRFLQSDPIGYGDGLNFYNYVGGDPVNSVDPSGLSQIVVTGQKYRKSDPPKPPSPFELQRRLEGGLGNGGAQSDNGGEIAEIVVTATKEAKEKPPMPPVSPRPPLRVPRSKTKSEALCEFVLENIGSGPGEVVANAAVEGIAALSSYGAYSGTRAFLNSRFYAGFRGAGGIGSVVGASRTALILGRAGKVAGPVGILVGIGLGAYYSTSIQNIIVNFCKGK
jgi:RHS repeat-associated protein